MIRSFPTPARANKPARAAPIAPHPTIATREAPNFSCPSVPIPAKRICREYRSKAEILGLEDNRDAPTDITDIIEGEFRGRSALYASAPAGVRPIFDTADRWREASSGHCYRYSISRERGLRSCAIGLFHR